MSLLVETEQSQPVRDEQARTQPVTAARAALSPIADSELVLAPADPGPGSWAGAPSALLVDGVFYLAYRLRRPIGKGRGFANVVARSADGVRFETVATLTKDAFGAESLERPALAVTLEGTWRLYVRVATPGTKHWRVDVVEATTPEGLADAAGGPRRTVLPGSDRLADKDPVIVAHDGGWHLWASCHPLDDPRATDRMSTDYATSPDGLDWTWRGTALRGTPGTWDQRGVRAACVLLDRPDPVAFYDGRATAAENWEERTGLAAVDRLDDLRPLAAEPVGASAYGAHGLRYVSAVTLPEGGTRLYYEVTRADGAHELRTTVTTQL